MNIEKWKIEWKIKCYKNGYKSLFNTLNGRFIKKDATVM